MTQIFMGHKPNVGPVIKILKHDADDPLTLANNAYDRYYFNSEVQNLSYIGDQEIVSVRYNGWPPANNSGQYTPHQGSIGTAKHITFGRWSNGIKFTITYAIVGNIFPNLPYLPLSEMRMRDPASGRTRMGYRIYGSINSDPYNQVGVVTTHQAFSCVVRLPSDDGPIPAGTWVGRYGKLFAFDGASGFTGAVGVRLGDGEPDNVDLLTAFWDLPADASPMPTYTPAHPGVEVFRMSGKEFIMARPGYSVEGSAGRSQRIIDSNVSPALCIMSGETGSIPVNGSVTLAVPHGLVLSPDTLVDMMVRNVGQPQYIPAYIPAGLVRKSYFDFSYKINPASVQIFNESSEAIIVRYLVFDIDPSPPSPPVTAETELIYKGNDGAQSFIQFKRPGASSPASKVSDIMLDTRFPMLQIVKEGFIPGNQFSASIAENRQLLGLSAHEIQFENDGFLPFVKYSLVFSDKILPPCVVQAYTYDNRNGNIWGPSSNQSSICRVENNKVKFWINPGSWSKKFTNGNTSYDLPDPLGIRYYIFGIAQ